MARVIGVGGVFFKSTDPARLRAFYARCLGLPEHGDGVAFTPSMLPPGGCTVWSAFHQMSEYFAPSSQPFMINLIVDDLEAALAQVQEAGGVLVGAAEQWPNGRFAWFVDPDGNKVELWQPCEMPDDDAAVNDDKGTTL